MSTLPALNELSDATNTVAQQKTDFEDLNKALKQMPGAPSGTAVTTLTIASGSVTPGDGIAGIFYLDTEAAAATDDLTNILQTNLPEPSLLLVGLANAARVVTVKHSAGGAGQISLRSGGDFTLGDTTHWLLLMRAGTTWVEIWRMPENPVHAVLTKTANYTTTVADRNKLIDGTANTWTLTLLAAASAGKGFLQPAKNSGTGLITIDGNGAETIDGAATLKLYPGDEILMECDGSNWKSLSRFYAAPHGLTPILSKSANYTVVEVDRGYLIDGTANTWTLSLTAAATLGSGFAFCVRNSGTGVITIDPNGSETIDGNLTAVLAAGQSCIVVCDGSNFKTIAKGTPIALATEQATTSGTSIDFTGIPPGTKRITIMLVGVSTNGTSNLFIQLGDAGGIETSGYVSNSGSIGNAIASSTAGFLVTQAQTAGAINYATIVLTLENVAGFNWSLFGVLTNAGNGFISTGAKATSAELDRIRLTTVNGTDAFDAGAVNISYE